MERTSEPNDTSRSRGDPSREDMSRLKTENFGRNQRDFLLIERTACSVRPSARERVPLALPSEVRTQRQSGYRSSAPLWEFRVGSTLVYYVIEGKIGFKSSNWDFFSERNRNRGNRAGEEFEKTFGEDIAETLSSLEKTFLLFLQHQMLSLKRMKRS